MAKNTKKVEKNDDAINLSDIDMDNCKETKPMNFKDIMKKASSGLSLAAQAIRFLNLFTNKKK